MIGRPHMRRRQRFNREPVSKVVARGVAVAALLGVFGWFALTVYGGIPGKSYDYVTASVPRTGNLLAHDPVRIAGRRVGQVKEVSTAGDGNALIRLQLEDGTELPADTTILLRANGLLGARYVELRLGRSPATLASGSIIRGDESSMTYGVTDALDVLDRETRGGLKSLVGELGKGTLGQGQELNDTLHDAGHAIVPEQRLMRRLARPDTGLSQLLPALNAGMAPLDVNREPLMDLVGVAPDALQPIVDRADALRSALGEAPSALAAADTGLATGRHLLRSVRSLAVEARTTLKPAPGGLRAARALLDEAPTPLARTRDLLAAGDKAVPPVLRIVHGAAPLLTPLREVLSDLIPISNVAGRYGCDIVNFGAVFRSVTGFGGNGEGPNGPAMSFRLTAAGPLPGEAIGTKDTTGLAYRESYTAPCKFLSTPYTIVERPTLGGKTR